jgi:hypothetical protein
MVIFTPVNLDTSQLMILFVSVMGVLNGEGLQNASGNFPEHKKSGMFQDSNLV